MRLAGNQSKLPSYADPNAGISEGEQSDQEIIICQDITDPGKNYKSFVSGFILFRTLDNRDIPWF